jgi:hypothetical protein
MKGTPNKHTPLKTPEMVKKAAKFNNEKGLQGLKQK